MKLNQTFIAALGVCAALGLASAASAATGILGAAPAASSSSSGSSSSGSSSTAKVSKAGTVPALDSSYEFRTRLSGNPQCQQYATAADKVFLNAGLDQASKAAQLKSIEAQAKAAGCLQ